MIDNFPALVRARAAVKSAGDPPELLSEFASVPGYVTFTLNDAGQLAESMEKPLKGDLRDQNAAAAAFKPSARSPLLPFSEHMQSRLKDLWRIQAAARYATIQTQAEARTHP